MGRRTGGGLALGILRRRIESCESRYSTVEELVEYLRSNYPDYRRTKQQPFTRLVQQTLDSAGKRTNMNTKRGHDADERLMRLESAHVKRRKHDDYDPSSTSSSAEGGGSVSTSESDLMKSMLLESVKGGTGSGGEELKVKDGPRFRDFGGMYNVLEKLKMEVIVPFCHPRLPQRLRVRPIAGILLFQVANS